MAHEKVTEMVLKVDLQCPSCYKKIKKILCKFPQIRDQTYDEKHNKVKIIVVCCRPEKVRDKLCCKGGKVIKSIEIVEPPPPPKPKEPEKKKEPEKPVKQIEKPEPPKNPVPAPAPAPAPPPKEPAPAPAPVPPPKAPAPAPAPAPPPKEPAPAPAPAPPPKAPAPAPVPIPPPPEPVLVFPVGVCCSQCYEGSFGGPCYHGPPPCYDNYGYGYNYGYGRGCYVSRCDYFSEENTSACIIM